MFKFHHHSEKEVMVDSNDLLLLGVGILIGLGFVAVLLLVQRQPSYVAISPSYVQTPESIRR